MLWRYNRSDPNFSARPVSPCARFGHLGLLELGNFPAIYPSIGNFLFFNKLGVLGVRNCHKRKVGAWKVGAKKKKARKPQYTNLEGGVPLGIP